MGIGLQISSLTLQTAEEQCGASAVSKLNEESYFVDFMRDAPEVTGTCLDMSIFWSPTTDG